MSFNGSGIFQALPPPTYPAVAGTLVKASYFNAVIGDLITGLTNCVTRDGQSPAIANLPMAGYRHTGVGDAVSDNDYASYGQLKSRTSAITTLTMTNANIALTASQAEKSMILITGALAANLNLTIPSGTTGRWLVQNNCTNSFTITLKNGASTGLAIPQGRPTHFWSDGTEIYSEDSGGLLNIRVLTGSGTYTPTPGTKKVKLRMVGAGGGGGLTYAVTNASNYAMATFGRGGAYMEVLLTSGFSGASYYCGLGGFGAPSPAHDYGGDGESTWFINNSTLLVRGGEGGLSSGSETSQTISRVIGAYQGEGSQNNIHTVGTLLVDAASVEATPAFWIYTATLTSYIVSAPGRGWMHSGGYFAGTSSLLCYGMGGRGNLRIGVGPAINGDSGKNGCIIVEEYA